MAEVVPLPLWPHSLSQEQLALIKRAKLEVGPSFDVLPSPAVPESPGRILAFGEVPPFLCESVLIAPENVLRYKSILAAMRFWLSAPEGEAGTVTPEMWLSHVMGCNVIYLGNEEVTGGEGRGSSVVFR